MASPTSVNSQITDAATVEHLSEASRSKLRSGDSAPGHGGHGGPSMGHGGPTATSVREVTHKGHEIRIETTYEITVDGKPVGGHVLVGNDGKVHYHSIPNQEFRSAVDMVKRIIDLMPPEPEEKSSAYHEEGD